MKIEKIEKVILNKAEFDALNEALNILNAIYSAAGTKSEIETQTVKIIEVLDDFIDDVEIELESEVNKV